MVILMINGETVTVIRRNASGYDAFHSPITNEVRETVSDVLVVPGVCSEINDSMRPNGVLVKYTLHFPKTYQGSLESCSIEVRGEKLDVIGNPERFTSSNTPGKWNMPVEVGGVHG